VDSLGGSICGITTADPAVTREQSAIDKNLAIQLSRRPLPHGNGRLNLHLDVVTISPSIRGKR
jgi:hypothetical protein